MINTANLPTVLDLVVEASSADATWGLIHQGTDQECGELIVGERRLVIGVEMDDLDEDGDRPQWGWSWTPYLWEDTKEGDDWLTCRTCGQRRIGTWTIDDGTDAAPVNDVDTVRSALASFANQAHPDPTGH